jgi:hypothetical protein
MKTPDEEVAERIINEFRKSKLLSDSAIKKIEQALPGGKLSAEDWALAFETDRVGKEDQHASKS